MSSLKVGTYEPAIQERDITLLRGLFESRVMTSAHIADVYFEGRKEAAKKRLQKLKGAGLIGERPRRASEPAALHVTRPGLNLLRDHGVLAQYPAFSMPALEKRARVSDMTLRHELMVQDVKAAFYRAVRGSENLSIAEFGTWPRLYEFESTTSDGSPVTVKPDGFIRINESGVGCELSEHTFFLEVDRSTESQDILASRAVSYLNYYKSGGFASRNRALQSAFKEYPFRVLMVFKTNRRRSNLAERLLQCTPPIRTHVCLATIDKVCVNPFGEIWIQPISCQTSKNTSLILNVVSQPES